MNPFEQLNDYVRRLETRLRWVALAKGAALAAATAAVATLVLVLVANLFAFSDGSLTVSRILLFLALAVAISLGLLIPLFHLNRRRAARTAERQFPEFEQRLVTFTERSEKPDAFLELLAAQTVDVARNAEPKHVVPSGLLAGFSSAAVVSVGALIWMITAAPGFLGYGASLLWAGPPREGARPFYDIAVEPGDRMVRKGGDQLVVARLMGFETRQVKLLARYRGSSKWETVSMQRAPQGAAFEFLFAGLAESVEYYADAGGVRSRSHTLTVIEVPVVKQIRATYRYPSWFATREAVEENGGDLRAVEGTEVELAIRTDRPLESGVLSVDGEEITLTRGEGNWTHTRLTLKKDGLYHVAAIEQGQRVRISEDYFIEARKDGAPEVKIARPGRDLRANPIEEVPVEVTATDDFGLQDVRLHYSVNGEAERVVPLLQRKGATESRGSSEIALEDFKLVPGDIVSLYATARDARNTKQTDIFFIEAQPFEKEYSQSQMEGGGGGMGGGQQDDDRISRRQKEIIAATWNQIKNPKDRKTATEDAAFLSDVQGKLRDQAKSLAKRMRSRELAGTNQEFQSFAKDMEAAAEAMNSAADRLKAMQWKDSLPHEQKALQHILRAESIFRQIQVAFGSRGGGGGGGGMGRDLENLFDLELDTEKNQYETGRQSVSAEQRAKEIDEALQKLEQLARRQQELAEQQRQNKQSVQQRWQQEMLRREAEQLKRQMEQLTRGDSNEQASSQQQQESNQSGQGQGQSSSQQSGQQGKQQQQQQARQQQDRLRGMSGQQQVDPRLKQALDRLEQATRDMRRASDASQSGTPQSEAETRRAAERLQEAREMLRGMRKQESSEQLNDMTRRAESLADQQKDFAERLRQAFPTQPQPGSSTLPDQRSFEQARRLAAEKQKMYEELQGLERDMQSAARDMAGSQRETSSRVREALGDMQKDELGLKMKYGAEAIRRGFGPHQNQREPSVTQGLEHLRDQLREARDHMARSGQGGSRDTERALNRLEQLREQMRNAMGQQGQDGRQPGQQQGGRQQGGQQQASAQQGQQQGGQQQGGQQQGGQQQGGQQQGGQQQGGQQQGGQQGSDRAGGGNRGYDDLRSPQGGDRLRGEEHSAMNTGDRQPPGVGPVRGYDPQALDRIFREGIQEFSGLRRSIEDNPELRAELDTLVREMQRLDPKRFPGNPALIEQMRQQLLPAIEHLELRLRRELDEQNSDQVRSATTERIPEGYAEAVAEYRRKLSNRK